MILQALNDYYLRKQRSADPRDRLPAFGLTEKEIPFVIEIDAEGRIINLSDTRSGEGKKRTGQRFLVPQGVKKTSGVAANLLWDTAEYVLGVDTRGKPERVAAQHATFRERVASLPEAVRGDAGVRAVLRFLDQPDQGALEAMPGWADVRATNPLVTFRLQGDLGLVCQRPAVVEAAQTAAGEAVPDGICLVYGEPAAIERLHPPIIGVRDKPGAAVQKNIVSINNENRSGTNGGETPAFASYGKQKGYTSPVGKPAAFAYTTALNHLLAKGSRQRIQVGDASTVFWAEAPHALESLLSDLFGERKDDPDRGTDALQALYRAVQSGRFTVGEADTPFHVLGLAPNAARIAVRFWETAPAIDLARRVQRHFEDIRVVRGKHDPEHLSLFRLLRGTAVRGKADNIPPNLGGQVMRAVLEDLPYPAPLLNLAVQRCRAEQHPTYARAAAIKASLNRDIRRHANEREFTPMLDPSNPSPAYRLGRLFAVLEKAQEEASPGLNATIRDRYYGAASSTPVAVFTTLLRLKNHHVAKLSRGQAVRIEKWVGEIMDGLSDFPRHLALPDQGRFALGYYHQRQAFFTKTGSTATQEDA